MIETSSDGSSSAARSSADGVARPPGLRRVTMLACAILVVAVFAGLAPRWRSRAALAMEARELAIPTVTVVSPAPGKAPPGLLLPAEVLPWIDTPILARASGYVRRWNVELGAHVRAGQVLAEIEAPEVEQDLERARQELAAAEGQQGLAGSTAERYADLLRSASVNEQETAEKQADLALKTAVVKGARANVRRLEELHGFARITAPFDGVIAARDVEVGDLVVGGSTKQLFRLARTDKLRVRVRVPQVGALAVSAGQQAELLLPERPNRPVPATVVRTAGALAAESRTLLVELEVDNAQGEVLAGSFAQVRLAKGQGKPPLTVPANTLLFRSEGPQVGVVGEGGKVELRSVKLGRDFGQTVEILTGAAPSDNVVVNPSDALETGARVRVAVASAAAAAGGKAP